MENRTFKELMDAAAINDNLDPVTKITKEEKEALMAIKNSPKQITYLIDSYYQAQEYRIRAENQARSLMQGADEAYADHPWFIQRQLDNAVKQEQLNKKYISVLSSAIPICRWMESIYGIGPVFALYLYASLDVRKGRYATDFHSYAGLNDNKNPWLGTEKAKKLVDDVLAKRQEIFDKVADHFKEVIVEATGLDDKKYKKFQDELGKAAKKSEDRFDIIEFACHKMKLDVLSESVISDACDGYEEYVDEWLQTLGRSNYVGDCAFSIAADMTRRKFIIIKRGTENNRTSKKNKATAYCTSADMVSYFAKPPYNPKLKMKMHLIGMSFVKQSGRPKSLYGRIYKERKLQELAKNENLEYKDQADRLLREKNWDKTTDTYKTLCEGKLSAAHIDARARRYATKLFLSHVYEAMYFDAFGEDAPRPYIIEIGGHHDYIAPEIDFKPFLIKK